jgi:putative tricarboxylic transport membrane protein
MKKGNLIVAGIFTTLSLFIIIMAFKLPAAKNGVPGPGYWPIMIALVMLVASITVGIQALASKDDTPLFLAGSDHIRVYISMGALVVYLVGIYYIGFCVSTFIMLYGFITWFGNYRWYFRLVTAFAITAIVYTVFQFVLHVPFRFGILF